MNLAPKKLEKNILIFSIVLVGAARSNVELRFVNDMLHT
jgi:hypothetical protein